MITADYHTHSLFSTDSDAAMEDMIKNALSYGLKTLCFTDHMDYDYPGEKPGEFIFDPNKYVAKIQNLKKQFQDQITLRIGVEVGMQTGLEKKCTKLISSFPFDFVICSAHVINQMDPYYPAFWEDASKETIRQKIESYFFSILQYTKVFSDFDVFGHLDYIVRYVPLASYSFMPKEYMELLDEILLSIIQMGKGIEINTAGYKYGLRQPHPHKDILKRYLELGGEIITIGSDGHTPEDLAYAFPQTKELLLSLGFTSYAVFEQRKPIFLSL